MKKGDSIAPVGLRPILGLILGLLLGLEDVTSLSVVTVSMGVAVTAKGFWLAAVVCEGVGLTSLLVLVLVM